LDFQHAHARSSRRIIWNSSSARSPEHPHAMNRPLSCRSLVAAALAALLAACASTQPQLERQLAQRSVLLLGEVHDNPVGHRMRQELLQQRVDAGWRPTIAMEQFDRERQADLDRALRTCGDADCVIAAASSAKAGWDWPQYRPTIEMALRHRLPIVAANVSRADAARVVRAGYAGVIDESLVSALSLEGPLPEDLERGQREEIDAGHCGQLPAQMLPGMVRAQVARDAWMAKVLREHAAQGVVLLAGNGHVRRDLGVPRWLVGVAPESVASVGFVEEPPKPGQFDFSVVLPAHARPDPCASIAR